MRKVVSVALIWERRVTQWVLAGRRGAVGMVLLPLVEAGEATVEIFADRMDPRGDEQARVVGPMPAKVRALEGWIVGDGGVPCLGDTPEPEK